MSAEGRDVLGAEKTGTMYRVFRCAKGAFRAAVPRPEGRLSFPLQDRGVLSLDSWVKKSKVAGSTSLGALLSLVEDQCCQRGLAPADRIIFLLRCDLQKFAGFFGLFGFFGWLVLPFSSKGIVLSIDV